MHRRHLVALAVSTVAATLLSGCGGSVEQADALSQANDLAAVIDGATAEAVDSTGHQFGFLLEGDQPPLSAAVVYLPEEACDAGVQCVALVTVESDVEDAKSEAGFALALDEDQTIEFKGNTQLKLYKVEAAHAGALLGKFGGEPVT